MDGKPIEVCVNIVVDHLTFEEQLAALFSDLIDAEPWGQTGRTSPGNGDLQCG